MAGLEDSLLAVGLASLVEFQPLPVIIDLLGRKCFRLGQRLLLPLHGFIEPSGFGVGSLGGS
jgi:hypothetical protein